MKYAARQIDSLIARYAPSLWQLLNVARMTVEVRFLRANGTFRGSSNSLDVALTFDDGPDPRWTPQLLEILNRAGARATFFFLASAIEAHPVLAREVAASHEIGTHLYAHSREPMQCVEAFTAEVARSLEVHERVLGKRPTALRFPHGYVGNIGAAEIKELGLHAYHWSFDSGDSNAFESKPIVESVRARLSPGCIVLLHDGRGAGSTLGPGHREATIDALPAILDIIRERDLRAVTLFEMT